MRHKWEPVTEDLRRSWREPRNKIDRCVRCGVWRSYLWNTGYTVYGPGPYQPGWRRERPECPDIERYMRAVAPGLFSQPT